MQTYFVSASGNKKGQRLLTFSFSIQTLSFERFKCID